jgi:hypothetical protein
VLEANGWNVGDQIVIAPSGKIPQQHEKFTIAAISGTNITLNGTLKFNHFGDLNITINAPGVG